MVHASHLLRFVKVDLSDHVVDLLRGHRELSAPTFADKAIDFKRAIDVLKV